MLRRWHTAYTHNRKTYYEVAKTRATRLAGRPAVESNLGMFVVSTTATTIKGFEVLLLRQ